MPVMALLLVVGPRLLPESRDPDAGRIDVRSAALSVAAVLALVFGLKEAATDGWSWPVGAAVAAGLALGMVFVRRQLRLEDPLIDVRLFRRRSFSAALGLNLLGMFAVFSVMLFVAQYLQLVLGMSPLEAGLWSLPSAVGFVLGAAAVPLLAGRLRPGTVMAAGLAVAASGFVVIALGDGLATLVAGSIVFSFGLSPVAAVGTELVVGAAPPERAGAASGLSETGFELGGALGIAVIGSLAAAVYRSSIELPDGLPAEAAASARDTIGGAAAAAESVGGALGAELLAAARDAFTTALSAAATTSAVLLAVAAALAAVLLRGVGGAGGEPAADEDGSARERALA
ncbi:MAG TPA: MFS transporter [Capillimicrobium sp.]